MQKTLCCDSLYRQKILTIAFHCQLMMAFGDGVLRLHHVGRGCREFNSGLASIIMIAHFILADQEETCEHSASGGNGFEKPTRNMYIWDTAEYGQDGYQDA